MRVLTLGAALLSLAVASCNSIQVTGNDKDGNATTLPGIPFYMKVAVLTQETKWVESVVLVGITVSLATTDGKILRSAMLPPSGGVPMSPDDRAKIDQEVGDLFASMPPKVTYDQALKLTQATLATLQKSAIKSPTPTVGSNTWSRSMVAGSEVYYINVREPLIGSATSSYKLGSDGTLSEASATVQDDTVKTILGLFPISAKLSQRWGLDTAGTDATTMGLLSKSTGKPLKETTGEVRIEASIVERRKIYTLRKLENPGKSTGGYLEPAKTTPLNLTDGKAGLNGVQLVSVEVAAADDDGKSKPDSNSYKIQGTVSPPKQTDGK